MGTPTRFNFFFFNDTATTEIYTLSLHDALPIYAQQRDHEGDGDGRADSDEEEEASRSEEHTSELQSQSNLVCRLLLEKKKTELRKPPGRLHDVLRHRPPGRLLRRPAAHAVVRHL